jgi:hypothetical protein
MEWSAGHLFVLMSMYDEQGTPRWLLQQANTSGLDFHNALEPLLGFSLVKAENGAQVYIIYKLVQLSIRRWLGTESELGRWVKQSIQALSEAFAAGTT